MHAESDATRAEGKGGLTPLLWTIPRIVGFGVLVLLVCWASIKVPGGFGRVDAIWPANALILTLLLTSPRRRWPAWLAAAGAGSLAANLFSGNGLALSAALSFCNIVEVSLSGLLLRRFVGRRLDLSQARDLLRFSVIAGLASPLVSATLAVCLLGRLGDSKLLLTVGTWAGADGLGTLILVPVLLTLRDLRGQLAATPVKPGGWLSLAALALVTTAVFSLRQPVAFLVPSILLLVVFQLELLGAALGVLIVVVLALGFTIAGSGPMTGVHLSAPDRILVAELFFAVITLTSFPTAAVLAQRRRLRGELAASALETAEHYRRAKLAEEVAGVGYWRLEVATGKMTASPAARAAYGVDPGKTENLTEIRERVHPDDRAEFTRLLTRALEHGEDYESQRRLVWPDGQIRHVMGKTVCERDASGAVTALFGTLIDITELKRAEAEIAASEARYRLLTDSSPDVVLKVDRNDVIQYVSPSARRYGYEPEELVGVSGFTLVHPDDLLKVQSIIAALFAGGEPDPGLDRTYRIRTADGGYVWMEGNPAIIWDEHHAPVAVVSQLRDITDRLAAGAALAESEARYRLVTESSRDIVLKYDAAGTILFASQGSRLFGYEPSDLVGRNCFELIHPDDLDNARRLLAELFADPVASRAKNVSEYRVRTADGSYVWAEGNPSLIRGDDGKVEFTNSLRDVTLRKALEMDLRAARQEAEAAAAVKGEFLANMSHELRTPLTSVLGFTRLAMEQPDLSETSRGHIRKASNAGAALLATVNDILDFSKLESGQLQIRPEPSDAVEVCRETLALFSETAAAKGVTLSFEATDVPPSLALDPSRLRQILLNLIGNSVKFSDDGEVGLSVAWRAGDRSLVVSITDQGPGIAPDQQSLLFRRFSQVDGSSTRRHGGTGLGLAICMGLVEAMGGRIGVESELGQGARFFFEFPAEPVAASKVEDVQEMPTFRPGTRVLVADDHAVNRELVRAILTPLGAEVTEAANGTKAVALASGAPFDLILMDLRMPELDGMDAMRAIRAGGGPNSCVPILAFSAGADDSSAPARRQAGFDGDLSKPLLPADLITAVSLHTCGWEQADAAQDHGT